MYKVEIQTTKGQVTVDINDMADLGKALAPYEDIYISCRASYCEGEAAPLIEKPKPKREYNTNVTITDFDIDWLKIKSACMTTISKQAGDKEPSDDWKKKLLLAEHSPIRRGQISWKWDEIPYAISTHFARHHEGCEKFVGTSREDRTGVDRTTRSQMDCVPMEMDANIQALINISWRRLCTCADPTTRKYWEAVLEAIREYDENIYWACVPQCVRCGGCVEFSNCGFYDTLMKDSQPEEQKVLKLRYDKYNQFRDKKNHR